MPIPGVHIEMPYGTRGCPGVMDTYNYRPELIFGSTTGMYGIIFFAGDVVRVRARDECNRKW